MRWNDGTKKVSQVAFVRHVERFNPAIHYDWPGVFRAGNLRVEIDVGGNRLGMFLSRLEPVMLHRDYDRLARAVWVAHWRAPDKGFGR